MKKILVTALFALAAAGCASGTVDVPERLDREYVTGNNLPGKTRTGDEPGLTTPNRESLQRERDLSTPRPTPLPPSTPRSP